ncbi:hypothetical protein [Aliiglaciecola sp. LCG003]|uniref:hypothetical protein n=1 Tax=Aliiglaciecola sp. LCG003 TaxID=3053655 RepID=UPI0025728740|nr:hypothetical protein [Aliiglaciecola sp. LCG003]WJG10677.1 hypothetical protein QR722_06440 [Aliiglaciecola sp. LCG003]
MKHKLCYVLCLTLLLQGGLRLLLNGQQLEQLRLQSFNDIELICTGKEMKWISLSQSNQFNHFVFVDAPEEASEFPIENLCPDKVMSDFKNALAMQSHSVLSQFVSYTARLERLAQQPYTAYPYQTAHSRAPPVFA